MTAVYCFGCLILGDLPEACFQVQTRKISSIHARLWMVSCIWGSGLGILFGPHIRFTEVNAEGADIHLSFKLTQWLLHHGLWLGHIACPLPTSLSCGP